VFIETAINNRLPLSVIFRCLLDSGLVPVYWKRASVFVIYKKGARHECGNHRPVSLISQACNIYDSALEEVIFEHYIL